jgi:membrane-associated protease RseP (regulator of RpoE activity)
MAKEFLSRRGVPFQEFDVSLDREAAMRMIRLSKQQGVPVITVDENVIVGFDRRRLEQLLPQEPAKGPHRPEETGPHLGAAVADAMPRVKLDGAYVGGVKSGSPAEKAGLKAGDVITALDGQPVRSAADVERIVAGLKPGAQVIVACVRNGQQLEAEVVF